MDVNTQPPIPRSIILCPLAVEYRVLSASPLNQYNNIICTGPGYDAVIFALEEIKEYSNNSHTTNALTPPIILAGLAGSLSPDCPPGSAWVARSVCNEQGHTWSTTWPTAEQPAAVGLTMIDILGSDTILDSISQKSQASQQHNACLVDTESHALAEWACESGYAFGIVRGVSDSCNTPLPPNIAGWTRCDGSTNIRRVITDLTLHPRWIPTVRQLAYNTKLALNNIIAILQSLDRASFARDH